MKRICTYPLNFISEYILTQRMLQIVYSSYHLTSWRKSAPKKIFREILKLFREILKILCKIRELLRKILKIFRKRLITFCKTLKIFRKLLKTFPPLYPVWYVKKFRKMFTPLYLVWSLKKFHLVPVLIVNYAGFRRSVVKDVCRSSSPKTNTMVKVKHGDGSH